MSNAKSWISKPCTHEDMDASITYTGDDFEVELDCTACGGSNGYYLHYGEMLGGIALELNDCAEVCQECELKESDCDCHKCAKCEHAGDDVSQAICYNCDHDHEDEDCECVFCAEDKEASQ